MKMDDAAAVPNVLPGSILVIKLGGSVLDDPAITDAFADDLVALAAAGVRIIAVHGGGPRITAALQAQGLVSRFVDGQRVTDDAAIVVVRSVLVDGINGELVAQINRRGAWACGGAGDVTGTLNATVRRPELGHVGEVDAVDLTWVRSVWDDGQIPVLATVGRTSVGTTANINADFAAGALAAAASADELLLLSDVVGVLRNREDPTSRIPTLPINEIEALAADATISDGMLPKLAAAATAICAGVARVRLLDGRERHIVAHACSTDADLGTTVVP